MILGGSGQIKLGDEFVEVGPLDGSDGELVDDPWIV